LKEHGGLIFRFLILSMVLAGLSACGPSYSPDTYASNAAQQANKVEQGVIVGVRDVAVSAAGTVGTVTGAAAGGIAGSTVGVGSVSAFSSLGGALVGGIGGSAVEHVTSDTTAFEYIVRKPNGDLVSVTQRDKTPLALGQKVLVISGNQARVVPDYTVPPPSPQVPPAAAKTNEAAKPDTAAPDAKSADGKPTAATPAAVTPAAMPADAKPIASALDGATPPGAPPTPLPAATPTAAPPTAAPPTAAPPTAAPPTAAPPAAAPPASTPPNATPAPEVRPATPAKPAENATP
jgi:outer membrane lipoprotein SlyB